MDLHARLLGSNSQYRRFPFKRFLDEMGRQKLRRLDFIPQTPHMFLSHTGYEPTARLRASLFDAGLKAAVLTPPPYRYSITAPQGAQRDATVRYYRNAVALAAELGADRVVLGAAGACWDLDRDELLRSAAETLELLCPAAEEADVRLLLAPVMGPDAPLIAESPVLGTAAEIAGMIARIGSPALGACLDTNVMSAWGDTIPRWFDALEEHIGLVRLCDGNYHGWRAWGEGVLPMERYLRQLEERSYRGDVSLLLPGERYLDRPDYPDKVTLGALRGGGGEA